MSGDQLLVSFHDNTSLPGYWDPQTSFANFCEIDYAVTFYIGEFINTLTNLAYVYYAIAGRATLHPSTPRGQNPSLRELLKSKTITRKPPLYIESLSLDVHSIHLILVGICSLLYHATLRNIPNILDQVSMFFLAAGFVNDLYTFKLGSDYSHQLLRVSFTLLLMYTLFNRIWTIATSGNLDLHSETFAILLVMTGAMVIYLIWQWPTDSNRTMSGKVKNSDLKQAKSSSGVTRYQLCKSFITAIAYMVVAFTLWLIDMKFCYELRELRSQMPLPLSFLLELHGWWHLLTAKAAGEYIALVRTLTLTKQANY